MGMRMPETCWAVFKWQAINLRDWCIWLVDLFECISTLSSIWSPQQTACFHTGIHYNCTWHGFVCILIPKLDNEGVNSMADALRMKLCNNHSIVCCLTHCKNKYTVLITTTMYICSPYCSLLRIFFVPKHSWSVSNCINISSYVFKFTTAVTCLLLLHCVDVVVLLLPHKFMSWQHCYYRSIKLNEYQFIVTTNGTTFTWKFIKIQPMVFELKHVNISTDWTDVHTHVIVPIYTVLKCAKKAKWY
jgi:hypothetical protein